VCRLKKALYGLKQTPRTWYGRIDNFLKSLDLLLYVDDLFLTGNEKLIIDCKKKLASKFEMKDLG
jgi:hypothetical protein